MVAQDECILTCTLRGQSDVGLQTPDLETNRIVLISQASRMIKYEAAGSNRMQGVTGGTLKEGREKKKATSREG